jgi:ornithine cyclodeaminase/alanine dehydrogenase-like protein (mu-crystallin family)
MPTRLLSQRDVALALAGVDALRTTEQALRAHGTGDAVMPAKVGLDLSRSGRPNWMNSMPGYLPELGVAGLKWAGGFVENPRRFGLPYIMAILVLLDPDTGRVLAVLEAGTITSARTGAATAVAAKWLAVPDAARVGLVGAGAQARTSLAHLVRVRPIREVRVFDAAPGAADRFCDEMASVAPAADLRVVPSVADAVARADVVVTATWADEPLVDADDLAPTAFVASLGSHQELAPAVVLEADKVVCDHWEQCTHRGELKRLVAEGRFTRRDLWAELGDVVAGKVAGREPGDGRIVASLVGMATEDVALGKAVYDRAVELGLGTEFAFV